MATGYRSVLRLSDEHDAVAVAEEQVRSWLTDKKRGRRGRSTSLDWDGPGRYRISPKLELLVVHVDHDPHTQRRLYRIIETNRDGQWGVTLYAGSVSSGKRKSQVIVVEVDLLGSDRETALAKVAPPRIVRSLLDTYAVTDHLAELTGTPVVVRSSQMPELVAAITDPLRTASVVVALSPARDLDDAWREVVKSLTQQSVGVTATYVVYADAVDDFMEAMTASHTISRGHIRTYLPQVDVNNASDGIRHKWLTLPTLTSSLEKRRVSESLQRRHGEAARRRHVEAGLPTDVQRMVELLRRAETTVERAARVQALVEANRSSTRQTVVDTVPEIAAPVAPLTVDPRWRARVAATFRRWLGVEFIHAPEQLDELDTFIESKVAEVSVASEQLTEAAGEVETLQAEATRLRIERDDMELEWAVALEAHTKADRENTVLRRRLTAAKRPQEAYVEPESDSWSPPESVEMLTQLLTPGDEAHMASEVIVFTGNDDGAVEIDRRYPSGVYAQAFWQHVHVLYDYTQARKAGYAGNVHMYLKADEVEGAKCPPSQHAARESDTVLNNAKWRAERVLPIPAEAHEDEVALMEAHFKPTWRDTFAPRMHYFDDFANSGKIYIGYLGRHLTNPQT
jgi:hypothetical protein